MKGWRVASEGVKHAFHQMLTGALKSKGSRLVGRECQKELQHQPGSVSNSTLMLCVWKQDAKGPSKGGPFVHLLF